ncbi:MAG: cytochrome c oxidase accessory protein CcoG [Saprospirales bacterium]|nr:MAG: cytochrome c oxidase accessory protein CcoG [Saprospirales bacterium]
MRENNSQNPENFRDRVGTIDESGKRTWIYPTMPIGRFYEYRKYLSYVLVAILFVMPFIHINGRPLFLFNIIERKFILFGKIFWPQDFFIFGLTMIALIVFLVLFTVAFGRIFCGWICPQTIFMEMVFRRIEYWIEGSASKMRLRDQGPWNAEKIRVKLTKWTIFFVVSFLISNIFLAYIIGIHDLYAIITSPISQHLTGFIAMMIFTSVFFFNYLWFREQVCLVVCPYGRLQGVMLDRNSIVVAYDYERGEPRGKISKKSESNLGDCIDCDLCVKVCPTGIDIRNGTQMECVNCTACIDACDSIMDKVNRPRGLIRYASEENIASKKPFAFTARLKAYSVALLALVGVLSFILVSRPDVETRILRVGGQLYHLQEEEGTVSNLFNLHLVNKTFEDVPIELRLLNKEGRIEIVGEKDLTVPSEGNTQATFFIYLPLEETDGRTTQLQIGVFSGERQISTTKTNFLSPNKLNQ